MYVHERPLMIKESYDAINPIVANLHNVKTNRYHPIVFREEPLPGNPENLRRHKSIGHHTAGFDTREEALQGCRELAEQMSGKLCVDADFHWDGDDVPAMVVFFGEKDGKIVPLLG